MDLKDLWIGEKVKLIKSGRIGTFEGLTKDQKARIRIGDKIFKSKGSNLLLYIEKKKKKYDFDDLTPSGQKLKSFNPVLDLHMEKLNPSMLNVNPIQILDHQIAACQSYIEQAIKLRRYTVTIIHGKGKGQLKMEVIHLLKNYPEVHFHIDTNNGGAQEVQFNF